MHTTATTQNDFLSQAFPLAQASSCFLIVNYQFKEQTLSIKTKQY